MFGLKKEVTPEYSVSQLFIRTSGDGKWSSKQKDVEILGIYFEQYCLFEDDTLNEIQVIFDTDTWDNKEDGLIYTDTGFLQGVKERLQEMFPGNDWDNLEYTEQGMQGENWVSFEYR